MKQALASLKDQLQFERLQKEQLVHEVEQRTRETMKSATAEVRSAFKVPDLLLSCGLLSGC